MDKSTLNEKKKMSHVCGANTTHQENSLEVKNKIRIKTSHGAELQNKRRKTVTRRAGLIAFTRAMRHSPSNALFTCLVQTVYKKSEWERSYKTKGAFINYIKKGDKSLASTNQLKTAVKCEH
uniref:Uncharacterized protein n=1 Tax=Cacopsylla melanoneura TaxID=428564 RepID=A0A8D8TR61_9HEMI